jgi:hypothetical protein
LLLLSSLMVGFAERGHVPRLRSDHNRLLHAAGFHEITELDVTPQFAATAAALAD